MASKLIELRKRTDQDLRALMEKDIQRALVLANVAGSTASPFYGKARTIQGEVARLLPTFSSLDQGDLAAKLDELRRALDAIPEERQAACLSVCGD